MRTTGHISCRSLMWQGERYVLYTDRERQGLSDDGTMAMGTISTPKHCAPPVLREAPPQPNAPELKAESAVAFESFVGVSLPVAASLRNEIFNLPRNAHLSGSADEREATIGTGKTIKVRALFGGRRESYER